MSAVHEKNKPVGQPEGVKPAMISHTFLLPVRGTTISFFTIREA